MGSLLIFVIFVNLEIDVIPQNGGTRRHAGRMFGSSQVISNSIERRRVDDAIAGHAGGSRTQLPPSLCQNKHITARSERPRSGF